MVGFGGIAVNSLEILISQLELVGVMQERREGLNKLLLGYCLVRENVWWGFERGISIP